MKITLPDGRSFDAVFVPARSANESWNEYLLEDGTVIRIKLVMTDVYRVEGLYDNEGNPVYHVKSSNVLTVLPPEHLKKAK